MRCVTESVTLIAVMCFSASCSRREKAAAGSDAAFRPAQIGEVMPRYASVSLGGDSVRIGPGQPVTLLNVWATWCTSCREEMATLQRLQHDYGARGVRVVAVSVDQGDDARVRRYVEETGMTLPVLHDPDGRIEDNYHVVGVPTTFLIGADGTLQWQYTGNITDVLDQARGAIDRVIGPGGAR